MIQRSVDVSDLSRFDFFNDAKDTIHYLRMVGREYDADRLEIERIRRFNKWRSVVAHTEPEVDGADGAPGA